MRPKKDYYCDMCIYAVSKPCLVFGSTVKPTDCPFGASDHQWKEKLGSGCESRSTTSKRKNWREQQK